jgi:hypothetical protein
MFWVRRYAAAFVAMALALLAWPLQSVAQSINLGAKADVAVSEIRLSLQLRRWSARVWGQLFAPRYVASPHD